MTSTYINNVEAKLELGSIQICCTESFDQTTNSVACSSLNCAVCASLCCCSDNLFAGKLFQLKKNGAFDRFTTETADLFFSQNSVFVFVWCFFFIFYIFWITVCMLIMCDSQRRASKILFKWIMTWCLCKRHWLSDLIAAGVFKFWEWDFINETKSQKNGTTRNYIELWLHWI